MTQLLANSLFCGAVYALNAIGFLLVYRTGHFFNFAHGIIFTFGAYTALALSQWGGVPLSIACLGGIVAASLLGYAIEILLYRPMRRQNATSLTLLLASLGIYIVLQNLLSIIFGDSTRMLRGPTLSQVWSIGGAMVTPVQAITILISMSCVLGLAFALRKTVIGRSVRAIANNRELAEVCGIDAKPILPYVQGVSSLLAGLSGVLIGLDVDLTPTIGMPYLMMAIVSMVIGGARNVAGVAAGSLLLAVFQQMAGWQVGSHWQEAGAFVVLLIFFLFKPQGIARSRAT